MEAKKQGIGEEELSMEEILQSIRRIIADDDEGKPVNSSPEKAASNENPIPTSDILELTEMVEDDGSVTNVKNGVENSGVVNSVSSSVDVLDNIDAALAPPPAAPDPIPTPAPDPKKKEPEISAPPAPAPAPISVPQEIPDADMSNDDVDKLLSQAAENAALSALAKIPAEEKKSYLHTQSPAFRSGSTVEDMVEDLLKPMLKEWLDDNLPGIVEKIVEREVTRLTRR